MGSKLKIVKPFVNVTVNIVAEFSGISEELAQEYLERVDDINCVLASSGFAAITEPDYALQMTTADEDRKYIQKLPVSYMRHLWRAYALMKMAENSGEDMNSYSVPPAGEEAFKEDDVTGSDLLKTSHIMSHSSNQGYFIPLEMKDPLFTDATHPGLRIVGGTVGSSYALLDELIELAPYLGIQLRPDGSLPKYEADRLYDVSRNADGELRRELTAWLSLHEVAELSISYGTAIVLMPTSS